MRIYTFFVLAVCIGVGFASRTATALTCRLPPWSPYFGPLWDGQIEVPIDALPWLQIHCQDRPSLATECRLVSEGQQIEVDFDLIGESACDLPNVESMIVRFMPAQVLGPGRAYDLECTDFSPYVETLTLRTKEVDAPSSSPDALDLPQVHRIAAENGCCGWVEHLEVATDFDVPYLREGGYIEVAYPNGQILPLDPPRENFGARSWIPDSAGPLEFTPIAVDGTRGTTTRVEDQDIIEDSDSACAVESGRSPSVLWLLTPIVYIGLRRSPPHARCRT